MEGKNKIGWHVNKNGLSNELIQDLFSNINWVKPHFKGVFTFVDIPRSLIQKKSFSCIVNIGYHFIAIFACEKYMLYIDSFGLNFPPLKPEIEFFFSQDPFSRPVYVNKKQIQDLTSTYCGLYASLFILHLEAKRNKLSNYKNRKLSFHKNPISNDKKCMYFLKRLVNM